MAVKHGYEDNRRILIEGLPKAGLDRFLPVDGAFYLYANVARFSDDSHDFAQAHAGTRRMSRPRPASISIRSTAGIICASAMRGSQADMREAVTRIGHMAARKR